MTQKLEGLIESGLEARRVYNQSMEPKEVKQPDPLETMVAKLASSVSYFSLQHVDSMMFNPNTPGFYLSFVDSEGETREFEDGDFKTIITNAFNLVFPDDVEDPPEVLESSAPPSPRNQ